MIDSTHAGVAPAAIGWDPKDLAYGYGAPLGPVILDANRLTVTVNPGAQVGSPAIVEVDDPSGTVQVVNQAVTHISPKGCVVRLTLTKQHQLTVSGCVGKGQQALEQELAIQAPLSYTAGVVRRALDRMHISLEGQILLGAPPTDGLLLSNTLNHLQLIADTLKTRSYTQTVLPCAHSQWFSCRLGKGTIVGEIFSAKSNGHDLWPF